MRSAKLIDAEHHPIAFGDTATTAIASKLATTWKRVFIGAVNLNQRVASRALGRHFGQPGQLSLYATFRDASYFCFSASVRWFHSHSNVERHHWFLGRRYGWVAAATLL
jgi:hypothetical protein